jgi:hypothetical protein
MLAQFGILCENLGTLCGSADSITITDNEKLPHKKPCRAIAFKRSSGSNNQTTYKPNVATIASDLLRVRMSQFFMENIRFMLFILTLDAFYSS